MTFAEVLRECMEQIRLPVKEQDRIETEMRALHPGTMDRQVAPELLEICKHHICLNIAGGLAQQKDWD